MACSYWLIASTVLRTYTTVNRKLVVKKTVSSEHETFNSTRELKHYVESGNSAEHTSNHQHMILSTQTPCAFGTARAAWRKCTSLIDVFYVCVQIKHVALPKQFSHMVRIENTAAVIQACQHNPCSNFLWNQRHGLCSTSRACVLHLELLVRGHVQQRTLGLVLGAATCTVPARSHGTMIIP